MREYFLFIYVVLKIYGEIRKKSFIDFFFNMGLCIFYDCVFVILIDIVNSVII